MKNTKSNLVIGVVNYKPVTDSNANIEKMAHWIEKAARQGCSLLLFPSECLIETEIDLGSEQLTKDVDAFFACLAVKHSMYIVYGKCKAGSELVGSYPDSAVIAVTPSGKIISFAEDNTDAKLPNILKTPWGPIGIISNNIVTQAEPQRCCVAMGAKLLLNPVCVKQNAVKSYKSMLEDIVDRDRVYIASASQLDGSYVLAPIESKGSFVSTVIGGLSDKEALFCGEVNLKMASGGTFVPGVFRPKLYSKWYASLSEQITEDGIKNSENNFENDIVVAVSNFESRWGQKNVNLEKILSQARVAGDKGANIALFPEMALTGYGYDPPKSGKLCMQHRLAEYVPGPSTKALSELAVEKNIYIVVGMPEKDKSDPQKVYNSAAVMSPNGEITSYRKIHPIGDESKWCVPGDKPMLINTKWGPIGLCICYDTYYIPELTRYYAAMGAKVLLNPTASIRGMYEGWWQRYYSGRLESTSYRDQMLVASANLCGSDGPKSATHEFQGGSVVLGGKTPQTQIYVGDYHSNKPGVLVSKTIDLSDFGFNNNNFSSKAYSDMYEEVAKKHRSKAVKVSIKNREELL